jgi:RND family efflux transporter MFP subunit
MTKKMTGAIVGAVVLMAAGVTVLRIAQARDAAAPTAKSYAMVVTTIRPEVRQVTLTLPYLAQIQNDEDVILASRIAARIEFLKPSGSNVTKGDMIARLDNTSIESNLESVKAQLIAQKTALKNLLATHKRTQELLAVKGASIEQSEMEESRIAESESRLEALNQGLNDLTNTLTYASIKSPVSGMISKTTVNIGDMSMPGQPIAVISAKNGSYLKLSVPADLKIVGVTMNNIHYDAIPLKSTFNSLAEYKVYVDGLQMMSGERVEVNVEVYNGNAIRLPFDAILNRNGKSYVFEKQGDKAVATEITILQTGEDGAVIANADLAGKDIVVEKQDILLKLLSGVSLKVKED